MRHQSRDFMSRTKRVTAFTQSYGQAAVVIPFALVSPAFFANKIPLGALTQTAEAFGKVQGALSFFVDAYRTMPITFPNISIEEAKRQLQYQDRILRSFPEVETVFGKVGRAESATDPAPITMTLSCSCVFRDQRKICRPKNRTTTVINGIASMDQRVSHASMLIMKMRLKMITTMASTIANDPNPISSRTA